MNVTNLSGEKLGPYELHQLIGVGGMAVVYEATQPSLNRLVALKVLSLDFMDDADDANRFDQEARTSAKLEHTNIISLYTYGTEGNISYVAMQLLSGGTLADRMYQQQTRNHQPPSLYEVGQFLTAIASALDYAHHEKIIHRDIKPSNIMFDTEGRPYVVDFGIAQIIESANRNQNEGGATIGTPDYMAPEQWQGAEPVPATDQYALAGVIYNLLVGHPPFKAPTPYALMIKHLNEPRPLAHERRKDIPEAVSSVLVRAMAKLPEDRYSSNEEFAREFVKASSQVDKSKTDFFTFPLERPKYEYPEPKLELPAAANETMVWNVSDGSLAVSNTELTRGSTLPVMPQAIEGSPLGSVSQKERVRKFVPYLVALIVVIGIIAFARKGSNPNGDVTYTPTVPIQVAINSTATLAQVTNDKPSSATQLVPSIAYTYTASFTAISTVIPTSLINATDTKVTSQPTTQVALLATTSKLDSPTPINTETTIPTKIATLVPNSPTPTITLTLAPTSTPQPTATLTPTVLPTPTCRHSYEVGYKVVVRENEIANGGSFFIYKTINDIGKRPISFPGSDKGIKNGWKIAVVNASYCSGATPLYQIEILETDGVPVIHTRGFTDRPNYLSPDN